MTQEQRKAKAIELLHKLDIYEPYIQGFIDDNQVCFFENYGGYWVYQEPEVYKKMLEIENEFNCTVYAITHEYASFGECYSFLYVSQYKSDWAHSLVTEDDVHYATAYVWNKSFEEFSELGTVGVKSFGGGITRVY
jgi:hypothetical protein